ncbi:MAG: hypothetical protein ACKVT0_23550, partial [Planctomycetaceae bacterium]
MKFGLMCVAVLAASPQLSHAGAIVAWGIDDFGQVSGVPTGGDFIAIAGGACNGYALRADGSIVAWGGDGGVSGAP